MAAALADDDPGAAASDQAAFDSDELGWTGRRRRWWQGGGLLLGAAGLATIIYFTTLQAPETSATTVRTAQLEPARAPLICPQPDPTPVLAVRRELPGTRRARHTGARARRATPAARR
jgi:hypothetical protein